MEVSGKICLIYIVKYPVRILEIIKYIILH